MTDNPDGKKASWLANDLQWTEAQPMPQQPRPPGVRPGMTREETIKKKTRQGLTAGAALVVLIIASVVWNGSGDDTQGVMRGLGLIGVYFVPTIVAIGRKHPQIAPIVLINLLLGWTVLGWIGALVWSVARFGPKTAPTGPQERNDQ
jgi:Superinfection immunity protein